MKTILHKAENRGKADYGWLKSMHSFSFANYFNSEMMGFGLLRVINDDTVEGGYGFETHSHQDMEIISIPLEGALEHKDSLGNSFIIKKGDIQVMSAGSGITHSEFNYSKTEKAKFLQIWIKPLEKGIQPSYDQAFFKEEERQNKFQKIVGQNALKINQKAELSLTCLEAGRELEYAKTYSQNGIYIFLIEGEAEINQNKLVCRDALGLIEADNILIQALNKSEVLILEVPINE